MTNAWKKAWALGAQVRNQAVSHARNDKWNRHIRWKGAIALGLMLLLLAGPPAARADMSEHAMAVPNLFQTDFDAIITEWEGESKSVSTSGCGMMCVTMALSYYQKDEAPAPMSVMKWAVESGLFKGNGLTRNNVQRLAEDYGLGGTWHRLNPFTMRRFLRQGHLIIAYMGNGMFTTGGHYILLRGTTADGAILVSDPYDVEKSEQAFNPQLIMDQAEGSAPFFVIDLPDDFVPSLTINDKGEEVEGDQYLATRPHDDGAEIHFAPNAAPAPTATPRPVVSGMAAAPAAERGVATDWLVMGGIIASSLGEDILATDAMLQQIGQDIRTFSRLGRATDPLLHLPMGPRFAQK